MDSEGVGLKYEHKSFGVMNMIIGGGHVILQ